MTTEPYNPNVTSTGMTLDTAHGPVDTVAIDRVMHGHRAPLTPAENYHLDTELTYDAELHQLVAEALGLKPTSINRRTARAQKRVADQAAAP